MGFDEGRMVLDSPNGTYFSGQTVHGKLTFQQDKVKTFRGLYVKIKGFCKVHWTTSRTRTVNGRRQTYTVHHDSHEEYINAKMYMVGGESGEHTIQPGNHEYPFQFRLPVDCPASFEGSYGHIRYEIKAVVDRAFKLDQEKKVAVRVMAPMDLNLDPYCREPIDLQFHESYCCCCVTSGASDITINVPVSGYCPGQSIPIEINCSNKGNVEISNIKLSITRKLMFIATSEPGQRTDKDTVAEIKKGPIPGNTTRNWVVSMEVPAMDVYNLTGCRYINLEYKFKVIIDPDGCHSDSEGSKRIVIGTVPLIGFQDDIQNPLQEQMPQVTAITQQPMLSYPPVVNAYPEGVPQPIEAPVGNPMNTPYPTTQPYPGNSPYPPSNPPYPTKDGIQNNPPYPVSNTPYPAPNSAFPASNAPYPASNSPYPASNPPYPASNSPYPASNPPYPASNSPYPASNPPYPASNSPYPASNPPYPASNSPYPASNPPYSAVNSPYPDNPPPYPQISPYPATISPYPPQNVPYESKPSMPSSGNMGGSGLKTGTLGFTVQGGRNLPYSSPSAAPGSLNLPSAADPFAAASAPNLDSPNSADKKN